MGVLADLSDDLAALVAAVVPATVSLSGKGLEPGGDASGSGFVVDADGHVVTNHHVIEGLRTPLTATLPGRRRLAAQVVGFDKVTDLAVLRLSEPNGAHLPLREAPARLGELCVAIGSPFGAYPESVSLGVVSGLARTIPQAGTRAIERALQTDAAINPGNSGGPLVDARGEVLGVNQCSDVRGAGLAFAIPADTTRHVVAELLAEGEVRRAALGIGVSLKQVSLDGVPVARLAVTRTKPEGPAHGHLEPGDVILTINGEVVDERADLFDHLGGDTIGRPVAIEVLRADARTTVEVTPTRWAG